tara:strand:+ start:6133 stop:7035 length:903 start_codon:yes stop_codon:yes gene_type:complete
MSKNILFSIILPTFNRGNLIHNAIESVINQTIKSWELIIVDDGSSDNTKAIIDDYKRTDTRIKYVYQQNKERSAARNKGINHSSSDWICFLDSDDIYHKNHLEEFNNLLKINNYAQGLYFSGLSFGSYSKEKEKYNLSHNNNVEFVLLNTIGTPRACVSSKIINEYQFNEKIRVGEDRELWVRILKKNPLFFHTKKTFVEIDHKERSVKQGSENENIKTVKFIIKTNKKFISKNVISTVMSNAYFNMFKAKIKDDLKLKAIYYLFISMVTNIKGPQLKHRLVILISMIFRIKTHILKDYK